MSTYIFVGWPLEDVQNEASQRGIIIDNIITASTPAKNEAVGTPYVIQERWRNDQKVTLITGLRLRGRVLTDNIEK